MPNRLTQMPDHSILCTDLKVNVTKINPPEKENNTKVVYRMDNIPADFLSLTEAGVPETIQKIENHIEVQGDVNAAYMDLCDLMDVEMNKKLPKHTVKINISKRPLASVLPSSRCGVPSGFSSRTTAPWVGSPLEKLLLSSRLPSR